MGKNAARITGFGFSLAVTASLALAPAASADPSPTLNGDCAATLQNDPARSANSGLLLDAGAPLNAPDRLTLGLDSTAKQTNGGNPLLSLPPGETSKVPTIDEQQSGNAQALPAVVPPAKLPMLLAVLALAVVAAALVRAWLRRKPV